MCGIAGFVNRSVGGEGDGELALSQMLERIRHRGPDADGVISDPRHGFYAGMRRLSIIDLEGGDQPILNEDGTVGVLFNGEIYNHLELQRELEGRGHRFRTRCDTEVLVHLYEECGSEMVHKLRGMFVFMIYDGPRQRLLLARDHFGQKPLYYYASGTRMAFGSEIKSLLALPFVGCSTDPEAFLDYLSWYSIPAPNTHFREILKLPAGSFAEIDLNRPTTVEPHIYWRFNVSGEPPIHDLDRAAELLDEAFDQSVKLHLRSDVPVGILLSGGADSKMVGTYASARHPGALSTFTAGYDEEGSEFAEARATADSMGSAHYEVPLTAEHLGDDIGRVAWHLDEPVADPAAFAVLRVCEAAKDYVKVLLSGEGADELFGGYGTRYAGMMHTLERSQKMRRFAPFLSRPNAPFPKDKFGRFRQRATISRAAEIVGLRVEGLPGDVRSPRGFSPAQLVRLLRREEELGARMVRDQGDLLHTLLALDIDWQLADSLLLKADKMSMAASIELRTPFLDVRLAGLAARMDSRIKLQNGIGKLAVRKCLARRDPSESMDRPKRGFPIPLAAWFRGALKDRLADDVFRKNAIWPTVLDRGPIEKLWEDFHRGQWEDATIFYALWLHEVWQHRLRAA